MQVLSIWGLGVFRDFGFGVEGFRLKAELAFFAGGLIQLLHLRLNHYRSP